MNIKDDEQENWDSSAYQSNNRRPLFTVLWIRMRKNKLRLKMKLTVYCKNCSHFTFISWHKRWAPFWLRWRRSGLKYSLMIRPFWVNSLPKHNFENLKSGHVKKASKLWMNFLANGVWKSPEHLILILQFYHFPTIFVLLKSTFLVTLCDRKPCQNELKSKERCKCSLLFSQSWMRLFCDFQTLHINSSEHDIFEWFSKTVPEFKKAVCRYWSDKSDKSDDITTNLLLLSKSVLGDGIKPENRQM